ncbi:hypothetical protein [Sedimentitalea todarodis]|uniref:Uncharacterized protein n=1 Tax=Sedimentitalea todarodis TaxID=1631240 RepID=A0ABU3VC83_9RHOB|nr:hypothetical protein [Sedimentitalea todarodis]MDU9003640.1 hypothetical protein [Sedimentitalea todarodis]
MAVRYHDDARRMDEHWFQGPCFVPALDAAANDTVATAQDLNVETHFAPETLRLMTCWADLILGQMGEDPAGLGERIHPQVLRRSPVCLQDPMTGTKRNGRIQMTSAPKCNEPIPCALSSIALHLC